jgi:hypothetical protein
MADPNGGMQFGDLTISGGVQNFGGTNKVTQYNYGPPQRERFLDSLDVIRAHLADFADRAVAEEQIRILEEAGQDPKRVGRHRITGALGTLNGQVAAGSVAVPALAAMAELMLNRADP